MRITYIYYEITIVFEIQKWSQKKRIQLIVFLPQACKRIFFHTFHNLFFHFIFWFLLNSYYKFISEAHSFVVSVIRRFDNVLLFFCVFLSIILQLTAAFCTQSNRFYVNVIVYTQNVNSANLNFVWRFVFVICFLRNYYFFIFILKCSLAFCILN